MNLDDALNTFLQESREMLTEMERLLLDLESGANDKEQLDALFRCVHTIKGSAGLFGPDDVVEFTHVVENVLDRLREGDISLDKNLSNLLINCRDHISERVELLGDSLSAESIAEGQLLLEGLAQYQSKRNSKAAAVDSASETITRDEPVATTEAWHISI